MTNNQKEKLFSNKFIQKILDTESTELEKDKYKFAHLNYVAEESDE